VNSHLKAFIVAFLVTAALGLSWLKYKNFLTKGSEVPVSTLKLNDMKESGVPDFSVVDIFGEKLSFSDYKDKVIIVNFWATWCAPCVDEFPSLLQLVRHFKGEVVILALSGDNNIDDIKTFLKAFEVKTPHMRIALDKDKLLAEKFGTEILPESYIIDKKGRLIRKVVGVDEWFTPEAKYFFELLVKGEKVL